MTAAAVDSYSAETISPDRAQDVYKDEGYAVDFVVLKLNRQDQHAEQQGIYQFADRSQAIIRSLRIRNANDDLKVSIGFSCEAWDYLFPGDPKPAQLEPFTGLKGKIFNFPATGGDIFLHVRANNEALVYECVRQLMTFLRPWTTVQDETHGFRYLEGRAIIGFIDGTEAPAPEDSAMYAIVGEEDPKFTNGSYAFLQKWLHNMDYWDGLPTGTQEKAVGRRKFSDLELSDNEKFANAHNVASKVEIDGEERKIVRMNVPYADPAVGITGTMFIGYARYWHDTKAMFQQMIDQGDFLLTFSDILTGQLFFIPSRDLLADIADKADDSADADTTDDADSAAAPEVRIEAHQPSVTTGGFSKTSRHLSTVDPDSTGEPNVSAMTSGAGTNSTVAHPAGGDQVATGSGAPAAAAPTTVAAGDGPKPAKNREPHNVGPDPVEVKTSAD